MAARPTASSRPPPSPTTTTTTQVSRKLFHKHLSRRPTHSTSTSTSTTLLESQSPKDSASDIVVRDGQGNYSVDVLLRVVGGEEEEDKGEGEGMGGGEKEKLEARLLELYRERNLQGGDPPELLSVVQTSLRRKVASLDEDNWMFEAEEETPC